MPLQLRVLKKNTLRTSAVPATEGSALILDTAIDFCLQQNLSSQIIIQYLQQLGHIGCHTANCLVMVCQGQLAEYANRLQCIANYIHRLCLQLLNTPYRSILQTYLNPLTVGHAVRVDSQKRCTACKKGLHSIVKVFNQCCGHHFTSC